jgi:hypothetical protein
LIRISSTSSRRSRGGGDLANIAQESVGGSHEDLHDVVLKRVVVLHEEALDGILDIASEVFDDEGVPGHSWLGIGREFGLPRGQGDRP